MKKLVFSVLLVFLLGCIQSNPGLPSSIDPVKECTSLCKELKGEMDFSSGPCIANPLKENKDWVCDIAHDPREAVDNKPENQCSKFREGKARHFVELNEECRLIKKY
jgi:hypothetical protein